MNRADQLLLQLQALASPVRLWVVAELKREGPIYVSHLARAAGISRPLMKMHLRKLEEAGLVTSATGAAENGKMANFYQVAEFDLSLSPQHIADSNPTPGTGAAKSSGAKDV